MVDKPFQFDIIGMHEKHSKKPMMQAVVSGLNAGPFQSDEHLTVSGFQSLLDNVASQPIPADTLIMNPSIWTDILDLGTITIMPSVMMPYAPSDMIVYQPPVEFVHKIPVVPREFEPVDPTEHFDID